MKNLTSRPEEGEDPFQVQDFTIEELELISSLLYQVRLGGPTVYSKAALNILEKVSNYLDDDFLQNSSDKVNVKIEVLDINGSPVMIFDNHHFDIIV